MEEALFQGHTTRGVTGLDTSIHRCMATVASMASLTASVTASMASFTDLATISVIALVTGMVTATVTATATATRHYRKCTCTTTTTTVMDTGMATTIRNEAKTERSSVHQGGSYDSSKCFILKCHVNTEQFERFSISVGGFGGRRGGWMSVGFSECVIKGGAEGGIIVDVTWLTEFTWSLCICVREEHV